MLITPRSPEAQYPQPLDEIYAALEYIYEHAKTFNIDPYKISLAGDSAGGNMAAATCIRAKSNTDRKLHFSCFYILLQMPL